MAVTHEREPCFVCETREREVGQILCSICRAWAETSGRRAERAARRARALPAARPKDARARA